VGSRRIRQPFFGKSRTASSVTGRTVRVVRTYFEPAKIPTTTTPSGPLPIRVTGDSSGLSLPIGAMRVDRVDHVDPER
jgi:hypothetical protein